MRTAYLTCLVALTLVIGTADAEARYRRNYQRQAEADTVQPAPSKRSSLMTTKTALRLGYKPLSEITGGAYPAFTPGVGAVFVRRETLPSGPFIAFDHDGRLVSTIYKFPLDGMAAKQKFEAAGTRLSPVDHVSAYFGGSHPGVDYPHYNYVFWHVPKKDEAKVAN